MRMRSFAYQVLKAKQVDFAFKADSSLNNITLPMQVRKNFYLIFKEGINNLVKYSEASKVSIILSGENNSVKLVIRDNGIGFNPADYSDGNGLLNMKRRAHEINAQFKLESSLRNGCSIELILKS